MLKDIVVIRSGGDIGTAIAHKLHRSGFKVLILETSQPLAIRRTVAFSQAIYDGEMTVEEVKAIRVEELDKVFEVWEHHHIPIMVDEGCSIIDDLPADALVDAILAKKNLGTNRDMASITIGIGPGFTAGVDTDVVIETNRGHHLGKLILQGEAQPDTGVPGEIGGYTIERVIKAPVSGKITHRRHIADIVKKDEIIAYIDEEPVKATIDGVLRGLIMEGIYVKEGLKIADIDPRCEQEHCYTISDKARAIAGGVLEAILYLKAEKHISL